MPMMKTIEISGLEYQVDHLLRTLDRLKMENNTLRQRLESSTRERSYLIDKNRRIAANIRKLIAQLREETQ